MPETGSLTARESGLGLVIGRFQPFHRGHEAVCRTVLDTCGRLLVILGSARQARSIRNPWSDAERETLIRQSLPDIDPERVLFAAVPDVFYNEEVWLAAVRNAVDQHAGAGPVTLYGHMKDASSYYLALFPQWAYVELPNHQGLSATPLRQALLAAGPQGAVGRLEELQEHLPQAGLGCLRELVAAAEFARCCADYAVIEASRQAWSGTPYPPIFQTVDALVEVADQILLVQRGRAPGEGQWALPGGFLDVAERLEAGARRELEEETGLRITATSAQLLASRAYDAPERSARGRFVTQLFHYRLDGTVPPVVQAGDDAAAARWWRRDEIDPRQMFEDHYCILQHALNWY